MQLYQERTKEYMEWFYNDGSPLGDAINEIREGVSDVTVTVLVTDQTGYPSSSSKRGRNGDGIVEGAPIHDVARLPTESKFRRTDAESELLHGGTTSSAKSRRGLGRRSPDPPDDYNDYDDDVFVWSEVGAEGGTVTTATNTTASVASPAIKSTKAAKTDVPVPAPSAAAADPTLRQTSTGAPATRAPAIGAPSVKPRRTRPPRATRAPRRPRTGRPRRTRRPVAEGTSSPMIGGTTQAPAPTVSGQTNAPTILPPSGSTSAPTIGGATVAPTPSVNGQTNAPTIPPPTGTTGAPTIGGTSVAPTPSGSAQTNAPTIPPPSGSTGAPTMGGTTVAPTSSGSGQTNAPTIPPPTGTTGAPTMGGSTENPTPSDENEDDNNDNNGCPANESYLGLDVVITISYRLTGVSEDFTVEEILAAPFSEEIYRSIYRKQYLNIGPFKDLTCTSELLFEPRPPPETGTYFLNDFVSCEPEAANVLKYVYFRRCTMCACHVSHSLPDVCIAQ